MNGDGKALVDRYVLFFDFLGAANAAKTWPRERVYEFVDLLIAVARTQSAQDISGSAQKDGSYKISIIPEITTFSDNVVVSYPSGHLEEPELPSATEHFESLWAVFVLNDAIRILKVVAEHALRVGLLIRGGLSFGQLYHDGDVVFGEALVDAYELERTHAKNPRILVSERVVSRLTNEPPEQINALLRDEDGQWHLNYLVEMVRQAISPDDLEGALRWKRAHDDFIERELVELGRYRDGRATKWHWFKCHFEMATSQFPAYFSTPTV
jgi:hypothetical protein